VKDTNVPDGNTLTIKVKINLNMLGAVVLNEVGGEVDGADVVAADEANTSLPCCWPRRGTLPQRLNGRQRSDTSMIRR
jgi:hypothetical protein